jgi:hypothetical protein
LPVGVVDREVDRSPDCQPECPNLGFEHVEFLLCSGFPMAPINTLSKHSGRQEAVKDYEAKECHALS